MSTGIFSSAEFRNAWLLLRSIWYAVDDFFEGTGRCGRGPVGAGPGSSGSAVTISEFRESDVGDRGAHIHVIGDAEDDEDDELVALLCLSN